MSLSVRKMRTAYIIAMCLALLGCGRDFKEYELDDRSFQADTIAEIQKESGINLPAGCKGLKYHYIPPVDPIVFAKILIPAESGKLMEQHIAGLTNNLADFPNNFASDRCQWWPSSPQNVVVSKKVFNGGYYIEAYLVREKEQLILYLKYFTI